MYSLSLTMQQNKIFVCFIFIFISSVHSSILTNLCSNFTTCNCTLTNNTNLEIVCNPTLSLSVLPTLINNTLQSSVTYLHVSSSINGTPGPLITLPINICSSYPSISVLDLSSNSITGFLNTSELACLSSNLIRVNFSNNFINNIDLNFFKSNRKLQTIDLSYNNLTTMPTIDAGYYINFTSTLTLMNFSYNQITNVDLWPLFVKTRNSMTIDMSYNLITNWTNNVPVYVKQLTETPDPRILYLNNNQIEHLSDLLLEQYGACSTLSFTTTAYFVVGISNILLTNNPLICDCESYNLITFIDDRIYDFPLINNGSALLTQATCTATDEQLYNLLSFNQWSSCVNYTLTQISNAFCSIYTNASNSTISPPTYWPTTTTIFTTVFTTVFTTIINGNGTVTVSGGGNTGSSNDENSSKNSSSPSWYIILGIVLGLVLIIFLILLGIFLCKDKLLPEKCRSKLRNNDNNPNNSYEPIIRNSELSSQGTYPLNGIKAGRASMSTSTCGVDDQDNGILQFDDDGIHSDRTSTNGHHYWTDKIYPEQETQTCFQIIRPKPSTVQSRSRRDPQQIKNPNDDILENSRRKRKTSSSTATNATTNTTNVIKGIPISSVSIKIPSIISNGNDTIPDTSISELSVTSIPLTPSKRAKLLPQLKNGIYFDSTNNNLLNTSASALITNQRQRRLSSMWTHNQHQNVLTPLPTRPQSMITCKTDFNQEDSSDEEESSIPTVESLTRKSSKPLRALPLLNITVIPAWIGDNDDQK